MNDSTANSTTVMSKRKNGLPLANWEQMVRSGKGQFVLKEILSLNLSKLNPHDLAPVANLATRLNHPKTAIKLLNALVRPSSKLLPKANEIQYLEYAFALIRIGAVSEARSILNDIQNSTNPLIYLYRAYSHIPQWEYNEAIPWIKKFISRQGQDSYLDLVAKVNLAASFVYESHFSEAESLLEELLERSLDPQYSLLRGNILELKGQLEIRKENYPSAREHLNLVLVLLQSSGGLGALFAKKWSIVTNILEKKMTSKQNLLELRKIRQEAEELKHWETIRDCDYYESLYGRNPLLLNHLYFGTPYPSYRKRLQIEFEKLEKHAYVPPDGFVWTVGGDPAEAAGMTRLFDLDLGTEIKENSSLEKLEKAVKNNQLGHRLIQALSSDFYKPVLLGALFDRLFPGEFFNPIYSFGRVYKTVLRTRKWFSKNAIPLQITCTDNQYRFAGRGSYGLRIQGSAGESF